MKNRLFPTVIGLCFISIIGVAFLRLPSPHIQAPVETESAQESVKPTEMSQTEKTTPSYGTDATPQASLPNIADIDMEAYKAALRSKDPERMKEALGPELSARVDAGMKYIKEKTDGLEEGAFPNFNLQLQEFMEILMGEDAPKIDWEEITQSGFREHFPEGEPEDYEVEMAERIHKIVADTPGDFQEVMAAVMMDPTLTKELDFQYWALAHFKGEIGQQMDWLTQQILVAGELENVQYTVPEDMSTFLPTLTETETQGTGTPPPKQQATTSAMESTEPPSTRSNENGVVATEKSQTERPPSMSVDRINSIRELLSQDGTDAGVLRLLETDKDAANWLLERFNSPTEIEEWLTKQPTEGPRLKPNPRQTSPQSLPPEVQP